MNDAHTPNPVSGQRAQAQFTAALLLERHVNLSVGELRAELKRIAPQAVLGHWGGPIVDPAVDPGVEMLTLDGEKLSVLVVDAPAPAAISHPGPFANLLWPNAEAEAARHEAHIVIIGLENPVSREVALAKARAITLLAAAIARRVQAIGATWADAANLVSASAFAKITKNIGQPGVNATPFWVRLMLARTAPGPRGEPAMKAGTLGLRIFGLRELEYASAAIDPSFIMQHAYSTAEYLLGSGKHLADGETIGVEGQARFTVSHADSGDFVSFPVACLSLDANN